MTGFLEPSHQEEEDKEEKDDMFNELDDIFNELERVVKCSGPSSHMRTMRSPRGQGGCDHRNFDFDMHYGVFCVDCGSFGLDQMPTSDSHQQTKSCEHKNYDFTEEAGVYCPDCGKVWRDTESIYICTEVGEETQKLPRGRVTLQGCSADNDFHGADLKLHPYFENRLHRYQKEGFKILTENLVGGGQRIYESVGCVLAHPPGRGKARLVICFIQSFLSRFTEGKPLILAPEIMLQSWENEFGNWKVQEVPIYKIGGIASARDGLLIDGGYEVEKDEEDARLASDVKTVLKAGRALKLPEWQRGRGVLLMSYRLFANLVTTGLGDDLNPESLDYQMSKILLESTNLVILDEGHLARNGNTQITRALQAMETRRRLLISGTRYLEELPLHNYPVLDLFGYFAYALVNLGLLYKLQSVHFIAEGRTVERRICPSWSTLQPTFSTSST